jgi:hypothetical protein
LKIKIKPAVILPIFVIYACLTPKEEHRIKIFEKRVHGIIFGQRKNITKGIRGFHGGED